MVVGGLLIAGGIAVIAVPVISTWVRGNADDQALRDWNSGGAAALTGAAPHDPDAIAGTSTAPTAAPSACKPNAAPAQDYALVGFPSLPQYGYTGVAGNGDWNMLHERSMVHYTTSAAPGQQGNVIIAFHREPHYEHIDQLKVGDLVTVQDRSCTTYTYRITQTWTLSPNHVTQLVSTTGHDITLITCTPWWRDYDRIVWRGTLVP
ncbi:MAG TPA: class E sortase [Candidatus Dormibacteraeota bacterium]|nr:class E sortase [Candidatus Dormibacteraeota bacterium]